MKLTKAQILEGTSAVKEVRINTLDGDVEIRPLTDGEWATVQEIINRGVVTKVKGRTPVTEVDAGKAEINDHKSDLFICRTGLTEKWSDDELDKLPAGAVSEISEAIQDLSGVSKRPKRDELMDEAVRSFRGESDGSGDSDTSSDGPPDSPTTE
jgi:hypothetical protein